MRTSVPSLAALLRLGGGFGLLVAVVAATGWLVLQQQRSAGWVEHTLAVQGRIQSVMAALQDAEVAQRSFLLTSEDPYLARFDDDLTSIPNQLGQLGEMTADNPRQVAALPNLKALLTARSELLRETVGLARTGDTARALQRFREGREKVKARDVRAAVSVMMDEESRLLHQRQAVATMQAWWAGAGLLASGALILLLSAWSIVEQRQRLRELRAARDALASSVALLRTEASNRESAEAQVRQLQKMEAVGQLTGGIAHDFNNMLAIVIGSLDLARRRFNGDRNRVLAHIDNASEGAKRAAHLTARLLAFSRQQPLDPQILDVNKLVGGMSELLRRTLGEQIRLETVLAGGLWSALADPVQLESAILNLCVNAKDAMPDGGRLTIESGNTSLDDAYAVAHSEVATGQYVCVAVTDTGTGMPPEVVERAFDPFYTTKGVGRGTGLGLSQVYGFVKQSAGHVKIYSEPGHGTTVKVYLPRHFGAQPITLTTPAIVEAPRAAGDEIILVVEDDEQVRQVSVDSLRELGYTVVQASDAAQALQVLALQPRIDLMFTDIVMPDMNGRRLADTARERFPTLKILYTTGYTRNAIVHNGMLDPGIAFLPKPFTVPQLATKVRQIIDAP